MLRNLFLTVCAIAPATFPCAQAEEMAKADPVPVMAQSLESPPRAQSPNRLYMLCTFYPKPGTCEAAYRHAMHDNAIAAQAVRAEYAGYARYLNGSASLTDADRQYLKDENIPMPSGLDAANLAGLHNVINDAALTGNAKRAAINNFLGRAVEAQLYCGFNDCKGPATSHATAANSVTVR
jgi:hypothetical protein